MNRLVFQSNRTQCQQVIPVLLDRGLHRVRIFSVEQYIVTSMVEVTQKELMCKSSRTNTNVQVFSFTNVIYCQKMKQSEVSLYHFEILHLRSFCSQQPIINAKRHISTFYEISLLFLSIAVCIKVAVNLPESPFQILFHGAYHLFF